jgi:hypothetical protein
MKKNRSRKSRGTVPLTKELESFAPCNSQSLILADFKETHNFFGFQILTKEIHETRKLESIHEQYIVEQKNEGKKPDKNSILRKLEFTPRNLDWKMPFKNSISCDIYPPVFINFKNCSTC